MSRSEPWSLFNTRVGFGSSLDNLKSTWLPNSGAHDFSLPDSSPELFAEIPSQANIVVERYNHPLNVGSPIAHPRTSVSSPCPDDDHVKCDECGAEFTGVYRRGNLGRHIRQKHLQEMAIDYPCAAEGCRHAFRRQDARLKHERKRHPELQHPPVKKRQGFTGESLTLYPHGRSASLVESPDSFPPTHVPTRLDPGGLELGYLIKEIGVGASAVPRSANYETIQPKLLSACSSDYSIDQDQDSVFSWDKLSRMTVADISSTSGSSYVKQLSHSQSEHFNEAKRSCPALNCAENTAVYEQFACHFRREHMELCCSSTANLLHCSYCDPLLQFETMDALMKHLWDFHMFITCLDSQMDKLDDGVETEYPVMCAGTPFFTGGVATASLHNPEAEMLRTQSQELLHSMKEVDLGVPQTALKGLENEVYLPGRPESFRKIPLRLQPLVDSSEFNFAARRDSFEGSPIETRIRTNDMQMLEASAHRLINSLSVELDPPTHSLLWTNFFTRWEGILEVLRSRRSDSYHVFAQALEDIRRSVQLHDTDTLGSACTESQRTYTEREQRSGANLARKRANPSDVSQNGQKRVKGVHPARNTNGGVQVKQHVRSVGDTSVEIDCIVYKHHLMHNTLSESPCGGFSATSMAQLRNQHLKPHRVRAHGGFIQLLERCERCKEDIVDAELWRRHEAGVCRAKTQRQHELVARWARLYLALYPGETRIPSPFVGDNVWLTDLESAEHQRAVLAILPANEPVLDSFLDQQQPPLSTPDPSVAEEEASVRNFPIPALSRTTTEAPSEEDLGRTAALSIMLTNMVDPHSLMRNDVPTLTSFNPVLSHWGIFDSSLQLCSSLAEEGISFSNQDYRNYIADRVEQRLLSVVALLRVGDQSQNSSSCTDAALSPRPPNERANLTLPISRTQSSTSLSVTPQSSQRCRSGFSPDGTSTQTGSLSMLNITDRAKSNEQQLVRSPEDTPATFDTEACPFADISWVLNGSGNSESDPVINLSRDGPSLDQDQLDTSGYHQFPLDLIQHEDPVGQWEHDI